MRQATAPGKPRRNSARGEEYAQPRWLRVSGVREFRSKRADGRPAALLAFFDHLMLKLTIDSAREGRRHTCPLVIGFRLPGRKSATTLCVRGGFNGCPARTSLALSRPNAQDIAFHGIQAIYLFMRGLGSDPPSTRWNIWFAAFHSSSLISATVPNCYFFA